MSEDFNDSVENLRKKVVDQIAVDSEKLIEELKMIAYDREVAVNARLQAIGMLLDRSVPKLAVDNQKVEVNEESDSRRRFREEIEMLMAEEEGEEE